MGAPFIDTHCHIWQLARGDYGWLTEDLTPLHQDYTLTELEAEAGTEKPEALVLVQAAPTEEETDYLLSIAAQHPMVGAVIGWTDLAANDAAKHINRLAERDQLVGVRPMIGDLPDDNWILTAGLRPAFEAIAASGLLLEGHAKPQHIRRLTELADRHDRTQIVLDHGGKPPISTRQLDQWHTDILEFSRRPQTYCKLSGLLTEAGQRTSDDALLPVVEIMMKAFGPGRLMFGSDWPVLKMAAPYTAWLEQARRLVRQIDPDREHDIFITAAEAVYGLEKRYERPTS